MFAFSVPSYCCTGGCLPLSYYNYLLVNECVVWGVCTVLMCGWMCSVGCVYIV